VGELSASVRKAGLHMGLYHSIFEWFHPLYLADKANGYTTSRYVDEVYLPQAKEINTLYKPDLIWSDGDWEANSSYWKSPELLAWLYNEAPNREEVIVNDRWGSDNPPIGSGKRNDRSCPLDHVPLQCFISGKRRLSCTFRQALWWVLQRWRSSAGERDDAETQMGERIYNRLPVLGLCPRRQSEPVRLLATYNSLELMPEHRAGI
jgi:alpha-L-fucosidase